MAVLHRDFGDTEVRCYEKDLKISGLFTFSMQLFVGQ